MDKQEKKINVELIKQLKIDGNIIFAPFFNVSE